MNHCKDQNRRKRGCLPWRGTIWVASMLLIVLVLGMIVKSCRTDEVPLDPPVVTTTSVAISEPNTVAPVSTTEAPVTTAETTTQAPITTTVTESTLLETR